MKRITDTSSSSTKDTTHTDKFAISFPNPDPDSILTLNELDSTIKIVVRPSHPVSTHTKCVISLTVSVTFTLTLVSTLRIISDRLRDSEVIHNQAKDDKSLFEILYKL